MLGQSSTSHPLSQFQYQHPTKEESLQQNAEEFEKKKCTWDTFEGWGVESLKVSEEAIYMQTNTGLDWQKTPKP